jgi:hypothetical protein
MARNMKSRLTWILIGFPIALVFAFLISAFFVGRYQPELDVSGRIEQECQRDFGSRGTAAVMQCRADLSMRYLEDAEKAKRDETYSAPK